VITLCDNAKQSCPVWPGQPLLAHWESPDPAEFVGNEQEALRVFWVVAHQINRRLELLASLPLEKLDGLRTERAVKEIGLREQVAL
jgi:arsenate reductase